MKLRYKILIGVFAILTLVVASAMVAVSYTEECTQITAANEPEHAMRAAFARCYGSPDVVTVERVAIPSPAKGEVLIQVKAAAVNPLDWHQMRGSPFLMRLSAGIGKPEEAKLGADFAGVVVSVGEDVRNLKPGDEVFGGWRGTFAEYLVMPADRAVVKKPSNISFAEAAAIPVAALTAYQALVDQADIQPGQRVLINGASGGVGSYTTQIAVALGAEVVGVCSTRNVEMVRSLGASKVYDYKQENYTDSDEQFDVIIDMVGNHSIGANRGVLKPQGKLVIVGGPKGDWFGPFKNPLMALIMQPFIDQKIGMFIARLDVEDLTTLAEMIQRNEVISRIDRTYPLSEIQTALRHSESGRARGKIIISMD